MVVLRFSIIIITLCIISNGCKNPMIFRKMVDISLENHDDNGEIIKIEQKIKNEYSDAFTNLEQKISECKSSEKNNGTIKFDHIALKKIDINHHEMEIGLYYLKLKNFDLCMSEEYNKSGALLSRLIEFHKFYNKNHLDYDKIHIAHESSVRFFFGPELIRKKYSLQLKYLKMDHNKRRFLETAVGCNLFDLPKTLAELNIIQK